jgi:hypothetical protein
MKLTSEQHEILRQVSDWKRRQPNVVSRVAGRVFAPMSRAAGLARGLVEGDDQVQGDGD